MSRQQILLFVINAIGGISVIASYVLGFKNNPNSGDTLWGGVPVWLRPIYTVSMVLSALGYFLFLYFILLYFILS